MYSIKKKNYNRRKAPIEIKMKGINIFPKPVYTTQIFQTYLHNTNLPKPVYTTQIFQTCLHNTNFPKPVYTTQIFPNLFTQHKFFKCKMCSRNHRC